jgi:hypothetical protein
MGKYLGFKVGVWKEDGQNKQEEEKFECVAIVIEMSQFIKVC